MAGNGATTQDAYYAALAQRVTGLENAIAGISTQITALSTALTERSKTPWSIILSGLSVLLIFISLIGGVIAWGLSTQTGNIVASLNEFKDSYNANRLVSRQDNEGRFVKIESQMALSVPREEHKQIWLSQSNTDRDQQRQLDELKSQLGSIYGLRDIIHDLKQNQDEIRKAIGGRYVGGESR